MVLTQLTQTAIAILNDITLQSDTQSANISLSSEVWKELFRKLESGGLVRRLPGKEEFVLSSYEICRSIQKLSLLELLAIIDEPLHFERQVSETSYFHHGEGAKKLGILTEVVRMFLSEIKISDW